MPRRRRCLCLGLGLLALLVAGCANFVPTPTATILLPTATLSPTARPTILPAVRDTATALAIAARLGGTPTLPVSDTPTAPLPTETETSSAPQATDTPQTFPSPTIAAMTPGPTRTPIGNPTGQALPAGCAALHTVQPGEWLTEIAQQYGVDVDALARANRLSNLSMLVPGQVLCIPGLSTPPPIANTPSAASSPTHAPANGLAILSLTADPNPVDRGAVVRLAWTVRNAATVTLWPLSYDSHQDKWYRQTSPTYTGTGDGQLTVAVPLDMRSAMRYELEASDSTGVKVTAQTNLIEPACNPAFFGGPLDASDCLLPAENAPAEFQRFERGFMIWRSDTGEVYALVQDPSRAVFWLLWDPTGAAVQIGKPPAGEYAPGGHVAEVWASIGPAEIGGSLALRDVLGWATSQPVIYNANAQMRLDARFADFDALYLSWPDGQVVRLMTGGGLPHAGTLGPAWFLFTPTP